MYGILQPKFEGADLHNIFSTQDPEYHAALKRTMGNLYTTTAVMPLEFHLDDCTKLFLSKMNDLIGSRKSAPVDLAGWLQYYTFDSLGMINFSQKMGFLESGVDLEGICHYDHDQMLYFAIVRISPFYENVCISVLTSISPGSVGSDCFSGANVVECEELLCGSQEGEPPVPRKQAKISHCRSDTNLGSSLSKSSRSAKRIPLTRRICSTRF